MQKEVLGSKRMQRSPGTIEGYRLMTTKKRFLPIDKEKYHQVSVAGAEVYYGSDILKAKRIYRNMENLFFREELKIDVDIRRPHK